MPPNALRLDTVAPRAHIWLRQPGPRRVLGVHDQAVYLEHASGLIAVTTSDVPLSPLSARLSVDCALPAATIGDDATSWGFDDAQAEVWRSQPDWSALDRDRLLRELRVIGEPMETLLRGEAPGVLERGLTEPLPGGLLGFGPGLTPAGDDVLLGRLFALHAGLWTADAGQVGDLLTAATTRTTRLSAAFLQTAAAGECGQAWQDLWPTPSTRSNESRADAIRVILSIGRTSGAAALWGFLTATEAAQNHASIRHHPGLSNGRRSLDPGEPA